MYSGFFDLIDINKYKSLICLNGDIPGKRFFDNCLSLPIIAVDGCANKLRAKDVKYAMVIGDLDSIDKKSLKKSKAIHLPDQSFSDFQKTVDYARKTSLLPSIILGISGGYIDHVLHNINIFANADCIFYSPPLIGEILQSNVTMNFELPLMTKMSFIPIPNAIVTTTGLKWDLQSSHLSFPGNNSCFNRTLAKNKETASNAYKNAVPVIDKMVVKGIIHKNKAARHKSRLSVQIAKLS